MKHFLGLVAIAAPAFAQTSIDAVNRFSWQENTGWMNWADANGGAQGVRDNRTFLSGFIWCENVGWMNLGNGAPVNGIAYANADGSDFGVNVAPGGALSGMAWGENIGWVNFSGGALASPAQPALIDATERFRRYAWGENIGWINLDVLTPGQFVKELCYANCDDSTIPPVLNVNDFACFPNRYAGGNPAANCDRSNIPPTLNVNDFACFLNKFASGCP